MISERENLLMMLNGETPEWVPNFGKSGAFVYSPITTRHIDPITKYVVDPFGVSFQLEGDELAGLMPVNTYTRQFELADIEDWEDIMPKFDLGKIDWKEETEKAFANCQRFDESVPDEDLVYNYVTGYLWDQMHYSMGFENALCALVEEPEACAAFLNAIADLCVDIMAEQFKYRKPDLVMTMDHVANKDGLLMSADAFREVIKPAQKKIFDFVRSEGVMAEMHVDGDVNAIMGDYADMGIQVMQPAQIMNDIEGAKEKYGMAFLGGWDSFGPGNARGATEEEVRASVRTAMDAYAPTGRYAIWFSGSSITHPDKMFWLNDEAEKYGHTFYR